MSDREDIVHRMDTLVAEIELAELGGDEEEIESLYQLQFDLRCELDEIDGAETQEGE